MSTKSVAGGVPDQWLKSTRQLEEKAKVAAWTSGITGCYYGRRRKSLRMKMRVDETPETETGFLDPGTYQAQVSGFDSIEYSKQFGLGDRPYRGLWSLWWVDDYRWEFWKNPEGYVEVRHCKHHEGITDRDTTPLLRHQTGREWGWQAWPNKAVCGHTKQCECPDYTKRRFNKLTRALRDAPDLVKVIMDSELERLPPVRIK